MLRRVHRPRRIVFCYEIRNRRDSECDWRPRCGFRNQGDFSPNHKGYSGTITLLCAKVRRENPISTIRCRDRHHRQQVSFDVYRGASASPNEHDSNSVGVYPPAEASLAVYQGARMQNPRSILILFVLLGFGSSLIVPGDDIPETPYDESEALPYEASPVYSTVVPLRAGGTTEAMPICLRRKPATPSPSLSARDRDNDANRSANPRRSLALLCILLC